MIDVLLYWRDLRRNRAQARDCDAELRWHSSARWFAELAAGDRLWLVTAGRNLARQAPGTPQAAFLVGVWRVARVVRNPGDDPAYPPAAYRYRVIAEPSASLLFTEPVFVDHILRPEGADAAISIGRFLQGPRRLRPATVRLLLAAAGPKMARQYLTGRLGLACSPKADPVVMRVFVPAAAEPPPGDSPVGVSP